MRVADSRYAGADVEELGDALLDRKTHRTPQERAVRLHHPGQFGPHPDGLLGHRAVSREIVESAQVVVVDAGRTRPVEIDLCGRPARSGHLSSAAVVESPSKQSKSPYAWGERCSSDSRPAGVRRRVEREFAQ